MAWYLVINKTLPTRLPQWRDSRRKYNIQGDIGELLGKDCEVEKMMEFLKEIVKFEEIWKRQVADEINNLKAASCSHCWLWRWVNSLRTYMWVHFYKGLFGIQRINNLLFLALCSVIELIQLCFKINKFTLRNRQQKYMKIISFMYKIFVSFI